MSTPNIERDKQRASDTAPMHTNWWLRLTSSGWNSPLETLQQREMWRRSRLTSWIILGLFVVDFLLVFAGLGSAATLMAVTIAGIGLVIAAILNHFGRVTPAGILLIALICGAVLGAILGEPGGLLPLIDLPAYDLLAIAIIVAASVLSPGATFITAGITVALTCLDFFLQPHAPDLIASAQTNGPAEFLARPIALQLIVATVAFLWVRGTADEIRRADKAEEMASLEHAAAEQKRQLDIGIQEILQAHVRAANGDLSARAQVQQGNVLWNVALSLNNLLQRLQRFAAADHQYQRTEEEIRRLAAAIDDAQAGRRPIWPALSGTPADLIIERITTRGRPPAPTQSALSSALPPMSSMPPAPPMPGARPQPSAYRPGALPSQPAAPHDQPAFPFMPSGSSRPSESPFGQPPSFPPMNAPAIGSGPLGQMAGLGSDNTRDNWIPADPRDYSTGRANDLSRDNPPDNPWFLPQEDRFSR